MRKIRVAMIGIYHDHAPAAMRAMVNYPQYFDLAGYCVEDGAPLINEAVDLLSYYKREFPLVKQLTLDEILNDKTIEAVMVEARETDLCRLALLAAKRGKHVYMDKPGGESVEEFEELAGTLKKNNLVFSLGYMYRQNPGVKRLFELKEQGALGDIISVEAQMNCKHLDEKRQWLKSFRGGMLFFLGCHLIDVIYRLQGEPEEVIPLSAVTGLNGTTSKDFGMVVYKYKNGVSFAKTNAAEYGGFLRRQLVVTGTKGTFEINPWEVPVDGDKQITKFRFSTEPSWGAIGEFEEAPAYERYLPMLVDFASYITGEKKNPYSYEYEINLFKLIMRSVL